MSPSDLTSNRLSTDNSTWIYFGYVGPDYFRIRLIYVFVGREIRVGTVVSWSHCILFTNSVLQLAPEWEFEEDSILSHFTSLGVLYVQEWCTRGLGIGLHILIRIPGLAHAKGHVEFDSMKWHKCWQLQSFAYQIACRSVLSTSVGRSKYWHLYSTVCVCKVTT